MPEYDDDTITRRGGNRMGSGGLKAGLLSDDGVIDGVLEGEPHGAEHSGENSAALARKGVIFGGIVDDLRRRAAHYGSDWADPFRSVQAAQKTFSGAIFMFFSLWFAEVALAESCREDTGGQIGVTEFLLVNSVAGIIQSLVGPQPLVILRPTGPVVLVTVQIYQLSERFWPGEDFFLPLYSVTGLFVGLYCGIIAAFELSRFCSRLTRFTLETFEIFVNSSYIVLGAQPILRNFGYFGDAGAYTFPDALFALGLAIITVVLALFLSNCDQRNVFGRGVRMIISDYAVFVAVAVTIGVSFWPGGNDSIAVGRMPMPAEVLEPTVAGGRPWRVETARAFGGGALDYKWYSLLVAAAAAIPVTALFYVDQTVTGLILQQPSAKLAKGSYFHGNMMLIAVTNAVGPLFGLPLISGSLPHSPQFARSLSTLDADGRVLFVTENRWAPLLLYAGVGLSLLVPELLTNIPDSCSNGVLIYLGFKGMLAGNEFFERFTLLLTRPAEFPADKGYTRSSWRVMHSYTLIQLFCFALCWIVSTDPTGLGLGLAFPLVIVLIIVPLRAYVMPKMYSAEDLAFLDTQH